MLSGVFNSDPLHYVLHEQCCEKHSKYTLQFNIVEPPWQQELIAFDMTLSTCHIVVDDFQPTRLYNVVTLH